jgi:hypothetical protein
MAQMRGRCQFLKWAAIGAIEDAELGRLEARDTADWKSALRRLRPYNDYSIVRRNVG